MASSLLYDSSALTTGLDSSHTARAYRHAVHRFLAWCDQTRAPLGCVTPGFVGDYIKVLQADVKVREDQPPRFRPASKPTKKLHLAALRQFFDKLVGVEAHDVPVARRVAMNELADSRVEEAEPELIQTQLRDPQAPGEQMPVSDP